MKKKSLIPLLLVFLSAPAFSQKKITEGTIVYNLVVNTNDSTPKLADGLDGATNTVYIKGKMSRSEFVSIFGTQTTIIDNKTKNVTLLKEFGGKKYMITLLPDDWKESNKKYDSVTFTYENETKVIAGYNCRKAIGKLKSGETFTVYYTTDLLPENQEFQYSNKSLPGLAMEYETTIGNKKAVFTAASVNFNPVPIAKFDLPKSGFRVMTYEESKKAVSNQ
jgi:GLPGLI family protein